MKLEREWAWVGGALRMCATCAGGAVAMRLVEFEDGGSALMVLAGLALAWVAFPVGEL